MTRTVHRLETIVVGTSLAEASDAVVKAALDLARASGARLVLAHGFPVPVVYGGGVYGGSAVDTQIEADAKRYRRHLGEQLERVGSGESDFARIVVEMDAGHRLLAEVAHDEDADLVVVGAHEAKGPLANFLGSTADRLLRRTSRPVLVVRGELGTPQRVLAPVDLSKLSEEAVAHGLELLDALGDEKPTVDALFVLSRLDREGSAHFQPGQVDRFAMEELQAFLARLPNRPEGQVRPVLRNGHPRQEILDYLEVHEVDLVLLGTHGRSGFERFLLGSVASEVLRQLDVHALVVPPESKHEADGATEEED